VARITSNIWIKIKRSNYALYNGDYPPSYKNQPKKIRDKATEIANEVLRTTGNEGEAIATGLKQARAHFAKEKKN